MRRLTTIPSRHTRRVRLGGLRSRRGAQSAREAYAFTPLLDAKAASELLGIPPSWLLAQARAGRVPHHRLGHYVRFSADDLQQWLTENRITPDPILHATRPGHS